jgi:hypothetical protein
MAERAQLSAITAIFPAIALHKFMQQLVNLLEGMQVAPPVFRQVGEDAVEPCEKLRGCIEISDRKLVGLKLSVVWL